MLKEVIWVYYDKRHIVSAALGAIILGAMLHFLYGWFPNALTALISPINESIWEHTKILVWPYLLAASWLTWKRPGAIRPFLLALPLMCLIMLVVGYLYHVSLGGEAFWVDLLLYVAVMAFGFWFPLQFSGPFSTPGWMIPIFICAVLIVLLGLFTLYPPNTLLFVDLSSAGAWFPLPC